LRGVADSTGDPLAGPAESPIGFRRKTEKRGTGGKLERCSDVKDDLGGTAQINGNVPPAERVGTSNGHCVECVDRSIAMVVLYRMKAETWSNRTISSGTTSFL